jgi:hypothetical protein
VGYHEAALVEASLLTPDIKSCQRQEIPQTMSLPLMVFASLVNGYVVAATPVVPSPTTSDATPKTRSVFDIFWSCWLTIFICTWKSIHPNIPPPGQGPLSAFLRRLTLMFWALIVPELILTWAVKQWLAARAIENEFKKGTLDDVAPQNF